MRQTNEMLTSGDNSPGAVDRMTNGLKTLVLESLKVCAHTVEVSVPSVLPLFAPCETSPLRVTCARR